DILNASGTLIDNIDYDSFGKVISETNPSNGDRYKFTGREFDVELESLGYYRGRVYSLDLGAFINEDPIGFGAGDANLRRYVGNNPANATDPSGLEATVSTQRWISARWLARRCHNRLMMNPAVIRAWGDSRFADAYLLELIEPGVIVGTGIGVHRGSALRELLSRSSPLGACHQTGGVLDSTTHLTTISQSEFEQIERVLAQLDRQLNEVIASARARIVGLRWFHRSHAPQ
ncbi:MAG: RHS repeat-associated core domain-containing protein, partial [Phycisphaerales bacterium]|nr:RHS repeat-associated core domain-containing protein [Phycisphaerales bacterium]